MPDDYPDGDVVLDAVFRLALRRIEKNDWSGAASVLDKISTLVGKNDARVGPSTRDASATSGRARRSRTATRSAATTNSRPS